MPDNGWKENEIYVLKSLERLETEQIVQGRQIGEIHQAMVGFKTNQKWEFRILSVVWAAVVTGLNLFLRKP
jgi:hypothetical protein